MLALPTIAGLWIGSVYAQTYLDPAEYDPSDVIQRDVCIIGGGSSGTYATIQLRDHNLSTILVEKTDHLGGHTVTYTDPATGKHLDYGVVAYTNNSIVRRYFDRLGVPYRHFEYRNLWPITASHEVDLATGELLAPNLTVNATAAWVAYSEQLANYPYLNNGFDLPDPVPADLLLRFGEFAMKNSLQDVVRLAYAYAQGYGNLADQTTLYVLKLLDNVFLQTQAEGSIEADGSNNRALYINATKELGEDVLFSSSVQNTSRNSTNVRVQVQTPMGRKLIMARRLIIAFPPMMSNLQGFDLTATEQLLFTQFNNSGYYTALLNHTGIADNLTIDNYHWNSPYGLPALPAPYTINPTIFKGVHNVFYGTLDNSTVDQVKADIIAVIDRLSPEARGVETSNETYSMVPTFIELSAHTPFALTVSTEAIANGFYRDITALQGRNSTFWTGAAWHTHDSSQLWNWTEVNTVPRVLESLSS